MNKGDIIQLKVTHIKSLKRTVIIGLFMLLKPGLIRKKPFVIKIAILIIFHMPHCNAMHWVAMQCNICGGLLVLVTVKAYCFPH